MKFIFKKVNIAILSMIITLSGLILVPQLITAQQKGTFLGGNIMTATNNTSGNGTWSDPVSGTPGEVIEFRVVAQNQTPGVTINNVKITASLPSDRSTSLTASSTVSGDNADSVTDSVVVNVTGGTLQGFAFIPGHSRLFNSACPSGCAAPDTVATGGVAAGNLGPGESAQVTFKAYITNIVPATPTPTVTATPSPTVSPTVTVAPTVSPTVSPTAGPTATVTVTPVVSPTPQGNVVQCPEGFVQTISGSNIICIQQVQNQNQSQSSNSNSSTGEISNTVNTGAVNVNVNQTAPATSSTTVQASAGVPAVTQLPKTGLPLLAWVFSGLLPAGVGFKKFGGSNQSKETPHFLCQKREFLKD